MFMKQYFERVKNEEQVNRAKKKRVVEGLAKAQKQNINVIVDAYKKKDADIFVYLVARPNGTLDIEIGEANATTHTMWELEHRPEYIPEENPDMGI